MTWRDGRRLALAGLFGLVTIMHVTRPEFYEPMTPSWLPVGAGAVNTFAIVAEGGIGLLLTNRRTARIGGFLAATWFVGILPVHVTEALDSELAGNEVHPALAWARIPAQTPLILWSLRVAREAN